ncbi:hypothetical protein Tco_0077525 [Tanacetum coccineum]
MEDENPIRTLGDYSKPSHEGYKNTIELLVGNNVVPLRSDTIRLVQNGCLFHGLWSKDPNQHLKDFLKLVDLLDLNGENRERTHLQEINDRMAEVFGLLKELTTSRAPEKVLIREEAKSPVTKNDKYGDASTGGRKRTAAGNETKINQSKELKRETNNGDNQFSSPQRIRRMILNSLQDGLLIWPTVVKEDGTTRTKKYEELSVVEKLQADCDLKAKNIVIQGLPPDVYAIVNYHKVSKEILDRVKLLMQGTKLSLQERECKLYDEFDKFLFVR